MLRGHGDVELFFQVYLRLKERKRAEDGVVSLLATYGIPPSPDVVASVNKVLVHPRGGQNAARVLLESAVRAASPYPAAYIANGFRAMLARQDASSQTPRLSRF